MDRRSLLKGTGALVAATLISKISGLPLNSSQAEAFLLWILRIILGGRIGFIFSRTLTRFVGRDMIKRKIIASASFDVSSAIAVSSAAYLLSQEHNAEAIWETGTENQISFEVVNSSSKYEISNVTFHVEDVPSGKVEFIKPAEFQLVLAPGVSNLPYDSIIFDTSSIGTKRIVAVPDNPRVLIQPSRPIVTGPREKLFEF